MTFKLSTLPILEQWDCHQCTACCRETTILLTPDDLARLRAQHWEQHSDYRGVRIIERSSWLLGNQVLAHRPDGSCVFLTETGRCRIHELFGPDAKPFMCRQFPLQVVMTDRGGVATAVRSCPSAAADRGRPLDAHANFLRRLFSDKLSAHWSPPVPPITRRTYRSWDDFHHLAGALERLLVDRRFPLVRRLVHGLRYCTLVDECKWKRIPSDAVAELAEVIERSAPDDVGPLFQERQPPSPATLRLFRRLGAHFIRCVPAGQPTRTWCDHWRAFRLSGQLARSRSQFPELHPRFPSVPVDQLELPVGPLGEQVLHPLDRFYVSQVTSKRYVLNQAKGSLVDSYRSLAFTFPMALWMLRWLAIDRPPIADDVIQIVVALERGHVLPALNSATGYLAETGELERLLAWYGR